MMKIITLKADSCFDQILSSLASSQSMTKSGIIREAVLKYKELLERKCLEEQVLNASLKTRGQYSENVNDFSDSYADGID